MPHLVGAVMVHIRREEVAAFAAALGLNDVSGSTVPWTFPAIWLAHPAVHEAIVGNLCEGEVPIHETQEFSFTAGSLAAETSMVMQGAVYREEAGDKTRLVIDLSFERNGATVARLICRLIAIPVSPGGRGDAADRP
jgi:hypothetical protein